jgi:hypothetical protein
MKEFVEQLKLYKEYVLTVIALVGGCLFVANYFATKEALSSTQNALNRLVEERECWLNNRITISEVRAAVANLEKERLEKQRLKFDLLHRDNRSVSDVERLYAKEQLDQYGRDFKRIDEELDAYRITSKIAADNLTNGMCNKPTGGQR